MVKERGFRRIGEVRKIQEREKRGNKQTNPSLRFSSCTNCHLITTLHWDLRLAETAMESAVRTGIIISKQGVLPREASPREPWEIHDLDIQMKENLNATRNSHSLHTGRRWDPPGPLNDELCILSMYILTASIVRNVHSSALLPILLKYEVR